MVLGLCDKLATNAILQLQVSKFFIIFSWCFVDIVIVLWHTESYPSVFWHQIYHHKMTKLQISKACQDSIYHKKSLSIGFHWKTHIYEQGRLTVQWCHSIVTSSEKSWGDCASDIELISIHMVLIIIQTGYYYSAMFSVSIYINMCKS